MLHLVDLGEVGGSGLDVRGEVGGPGHGRPGVAWGDGAGRAGDLLDGWWGLKLGVGDGDGVPVLWASTASDDIFVAGVGLGRSWVVCNGVVQLAVMLFGIKI